MTFTKLAAIGAVLAMTATPAMADKIVGNWTVTETGAGARISKCGSAFCAKLTTGKFAGKTIGRLTGGNGNYAGKLTDPRDGKTFRGKAWFSGKNLKLRGYSGILFRTQTWSPR